MDVAFLYRFPSGPYEWVVSLVVGEALEVVKRVFKCPADDAVVDHAGRNNPLTPIENFFGEGRPGLGVGQALLAQVLECLAAELARVSDLPYGALGARGDDRRVDGVVAVVLAVFLAVVAEVEAPDPA